MNNIIDFRRKEYQEIENKIRECIKVVEEETDFILEKFDISFSPEKNSIDKTLKNKISLVFKSTKKNSKTIDLSMFLPIYDNDKFIINGFEKIPYFQMLDVPFRITDEFITIKLSMASISFAPYKETNGFKFYINFLGKKCPASLIFYYFLKDKVFDYQPNDGHPFYNEFIEELHTVGTESSEIDDSDLIQEIGKYISDVDIYNKGDDFLYAIKIAPKIDILHTRFFHTENKNLIEEFLYILQNNISYDDLDLRNKWIRSESFTALIISKLFEFMIHNRRHKPRFKVNKQFLLSHCNQNPTIQYDFSINPIDYYTKLLRVSLIGPNSFNRDNIPPKFRDLHESFYGRIDPVDTPDRENCGVIQSLIPSVNVDENGRFTDIISNEIVTIPLLTPFIEHDDQTRLQMAASQMRQAIPLEEFDIPYICTTANKDFLNDSKTVIRAKDDGEVIYNDSINYLLVAYKNGEIDIIKIGFVNKQNNLNIYYPNHEILENKKFNKGDILAYSHYYNSVLSFGKNLLTGITINGYNYEDGIVISESASKKLTSLHIEEYELFVNPDQVLLLLDNGKPLYEELEVIEQGKKLFRLKNIPTKYSQDSSKILYEETEDLATKTYLVSNLQTFPNEWNSNIRGYKEFIEERIEKENKRNKEIRSLIEQAYGKSEKYKYLCEKYNLNILDFIGRIKYKDERINGVLFKFNLVYKDYISLGDKLANRHGGKGVITQILPDEKMPVTDKGERIEVLLNPLGIISRMNLGQLFELHLGLAFYQLKENAKQMLKDNVPSFKIKEYIFNFIELIDATHDKKMVNNFNKLLENRTIDEDFINNLFILVFPFESPKYENIVKALEYVNRDFEEKIYDPFLDKQYNIALGYMYIMKLNHIAKEKIAARSIGPYSKRTLQPLGGKRNKGGQRFGEMETACLIALDMPETLQEFFLRSDSLDYVKNLINENQVTTNIKTQSEIVHLFDSYLKVIGVEIKDHKTSSTKESENES